MGKDCERIYDCIIVGGGVIGAFAARELMRFRGRFLLLEAGNDVAVGTTKANSGIVHAGFDAAPNTKKAKYNVLGSRLMEKKCRELDVPYKRNGALVLAFGNDGDIRRLRARGMTNGVDTEILSGDAARTLEPLLSDKVTSALFAPSSAVVSPYELAIACCENYTANGGELKTNSRVKTVRRGARGFWYVETDGGVYLTRTVINAAGLYSDDVHNGACADGISITARRGRYMLLDKAAKPVERTVFQTPTALGKGVLVAPTCHGNTLIGPSAETVDDRADVSTTADVLGAVFERARLSVPTLSKRDIITQFSGLRAVCGEDFVLGESADGFFDAAGICSPGLASSPAIGEYLAEAVAAKLGLAENKSFEPRRGDIPLCRSDGRRARGENSGRSALRQDSVPLRERHRGRDSRGGAPRRGRSRRRKASGARRHGQVSGGVLHAQPHKDNSARAGHFAELRDQERRRLDRARAGEV